MCMLKIEPSQNPIFAANWRLHCYDFLRMNTIFRQGTCVKQKIMPICDMEQFVERSSLHDP
jgi:hypothetical protein